MESVPWHVVAEYWTLSEALVARRVCHLLAEGVDGLSPQACARILGKALIKRNMHVLPYGSWYEAIIPQEADDNALTEFLIGNNEYRSNTSAAFDTMLRCFRVMQCIPTEVAVAYNGKYGRHCLPLEWSVDDSFQVKEYRRCKRTKCKTCRFRIPLQESVQPHETRPSGSLEERNAATGENSSDSDTEDEDESQNEDEEDEDDEEINLDDTWNDIYQYIHVQGNNKDGSPVDITRFYNTCVPNLPPDLNCPCCRTSEERTLVLSEFSYKAAAGAAGRVALLTFTPEDDGHAQAYSRQAKRPRLEQQASQDNNGDDSFVIPPMYEDMAIPTRAVPLKRRPDAKHAIAIHCTKCKTFGMAAPAEPCWDARFPCLERTKRHNKAVVGGVLSRRPCDAASCHAPVLCSSCSRQSIRMDYNGESMSFQNRCPTHKHIYCESCLWLSTVCCHW